jgi:pimeloyl-ACP methyl ester carboxylesterase
MDIEYCSGTIIPIPFNHHKIDAVFRHLVTHKDHVENKPIIIRLHGIIGNLLDETEHFLPTFLAHQGYSSITMNTLLANLGLFYGFGIFDDVMPQIDAVFNFVRGMGFRKLVLSGHGLGGCMAIRYGALRNDPAKYPDILGVIAIATPYSLPDTISRRWERFASEPEYAEVYRQATHLFHPEPGEEPAGDRTIIVKKAHGPTYLPEHTEVYTLKTWWALVGPEADGAKTYKHIGDIKVPLLLVQGLQDDIIEPREAAKLESLARDAGNPDVSSSYLAAGHTFQGKHAELGQIIVQWLNDRFE